MTGFSSGMREERIKIMNRASATADDFGRDASGITWEDTCCVHADISWVKGLSAMREGAIDVYGIIMVRMNYNEAVNMRSRIVWLNQTYQILPETFHPDRRANTIQFNAQILIND